jgi:hypothetical protein
MKILIGYSMRSGSTLLQHMLNEHSRLRSFSDVSSLPVLMGIACGVRVDDVCVKPPDLVYLHGDAGLLRPFDRRIWLARDPRDSYLSSVESNYPYLFWPRGRMVEGIDVGLLHRWKRVYRRYFGGPHRWHLVKYEDLAQRPAETMRALFDYLGLDYEDVLQPRPFRWSSGGDTKLAKNPKVHAKSVGRHAGVLSDAQMALFADGLGGEMRALGYDPGGWGRAG